LSKFRAFDLENFENKTLGIDKRILQQNRIPLETE